MLHNSRKSFIYTDESNCSPQHAFNQDGVITPASQYSMQDDRNQYSFMSNINSSL